MEKADYYIKTPNWIVNRKDLSIGAKFLYGAVNTLSNNENHACCALNPCLANLFNVDVRTISRWLKELKTQKLIVIHKDYKNGKVKKRSILPYKKMERCGKTVIN